MTQRSSGPADQAGHDWPDDLWPDDDQAGPGGTAGDSSPPRQAWAPTASAGKPETAPRSRRVRPGVLAVIIVLAAAAGAGITAAAVHGISSPGAVASGRTGPGGQPGGNGAPGSRGAPGSGTVPGGGAVPGGAVPGGGSGSGSGRAGGLFLIGTVTAVSRTSITIGGPGHTITAAVTGATRVTGKVSAITGIKAGDLVSAQITRNSAGNVAVAIADPAQPPAGGSLP